MDQPLDAERAARIRHANYLMKCLIDPEAGARVRAAQLLGEIREVRAVEPLCAALFDAEAAVRQQAVIALGRLGPPALEALTNALGNPDPLVQKFLTVDFKPQPAGVD